MPLQACKLKLKCAQKDGKASNSVANQIGFIKSSKFELCAKAVDSTVLNQLVAVLFD